MLATLVREPFHKSGWVYEEKYDGYRILAYKEGSRVRLYSRNAIDRTDRFFDVATAMSTLRPSTLLLDGDLSFPLGDILLLLQVERQGLGPNSQAHDLLERAVRRASPRPAHACRSTCAPSCACR